MRAVLALDDEGVEDGAVAPHGGGLREPCRFVRREAVPGELCVEIGCPEQEHGPAGLQVAVAIRIIGERRHERAVGAIGGVKCVRSSVPPGVSTRAISVTAVRQASSDAAPGRMPMATTPSNEAFG